MSSGPYDAINWEQTALGLQMRVPPLPLNTPDAGDVRLGVVFGPQELVGTLEAGECDYPIESHVLRNIVYGFGEFTGTLDPGGVILPDSTESERWFATMAKLKGATAVYTRGETSADVVVIPMGAELSSDEFGGMVRRGDRKDFLILTTAFADFGLPERGDMIRVRNVNWQVTEPPYRQQSIDDIIVRAYAQRRA